MNLSWDYHWLEEAKLIATRSKDLSVKVGACIVDPKQRLVSKGYNGFPRGIADDPALYADRPSKLARVMHAEINAILFAYRDLTGCTLYVTLPPCERCAVILIQSGISRVVAPHGIRDRWSDSIELACDLFSEAGVVVDLLPPSPEK